jgi:hypothetical protein
MLPDEALTFLRVNGGTDPGDYYWLEISRNVRDDVQPLIEITEVESFLHWDKDELALIPWRASHIIRNLDALVTVDNTIERIEPGPHGSIVTFRKDVGATDVKFSDAPTGNANANIDITSSPSRTLDEDWEVITFLSVHTDWARTGTPLERDIEWVELKTTVDDA